MHGFQYGTSLWIAADPASVQKTTLPVQIVFNHTIVAIRSVAGDDTVYFQFQNIDCRRLLEAEMVFKSIQENSVYHVHNTFY